MTLPKPNSPYYVFFDLDETLISKKSMFSFLRFYCVRYKNRIFFKGIWLYFFYYYKFKFLSYLGKPREYINLLYYKFFCGIDSKFLKKICCDWFCDCIKKDKNFFNSNVVNLLELHKENGGIPVLVSGSFIECLKPIADFCGIQHLLAIKLEKDKYERYTGNILPPQTIGAGKTIAIQKFLEQRSFYDYKCCFAYGDHISDKSMLELVGNPCAVIHSHNKSFGEYACKQGWGILHANLYKNSCP